MFKKLLLIAMLTLLVTISFSTLASGSDLTLTVQKSPLDIYPPMMIYTASLNWPLPISSTTQIRVDFYNGLVGGPPMILIGSALLDLRTGKAVLNKQMNPGSYMAVAQTTVNGTVYVSNTVYYKVP